MIKSEIDAWYNGYGNRFRATRATMGRLGCQDKPSERKIYYLVLLFITTIQAASSFVIQFLIICNYQAIKQFFYFPGEQTSSLAASEIFIVLSIFVLVLFFIFIFNVITLFRLSRSLNTINTAKKEMWNRDLLDENDFFRRRAILKAYKSYFNR